MKMTKISSSCWKFSVSWEIIMEMENKEEAFSLTRRFILEVSAASPQSCEIIDFSVVSFTQRSFSLVAN